MQNTYQDLITAVQNKNPAISPKLEGGKKFQMKTDFKPAGDQPEAIKQLVNGANKDQLSQVLLGVTGSGKTFTMAKIIESTNRPALILAPNKTLAAQLYGEMKSFFPNNAVEYFVSYYDYYQPEAYVPRTDTYIEKESSINEQIDRMRHSATRALFERKDVIIVASVSCIYGIGSPETYSTMTFTLNKHEIIKRNYLITKLVELQYVRNDINFYRGTFRVRGDIIDIFPSSQKGQIRSMMSESLEAVIAQKLIPTKDSKGRIPACEVMIVTTAIRNLIREDRIYQIESVMQSGGVEGMQTLDQDLQRLVAQGNIERAMAAQIANNPKLFGANVL